MNYTLNQLNVFLKIVKNESITKAAEELHLTQPAVSIQLKNFQDQFEIPLTEVIGRKLFVTEFGKEIALAAEKIIEQVQAINTKTSIFNGKLTGKLKISVVSTGKYVMPYFLSGFLNENSEVELFMDVTNKQKVIESLENNEVDFALVSLIPKRINVNKIDLLQNKLFLVGAYQEQKSKNKLSLDFIKDKSLIFRENGSGTRQVMEEFIENHEISVTKKMQLTTNEAVKQALIAGFGYSIMPLIGIKNELKNKQLQIYPIQNLPITTMWRLVWMKGKNHSPVAVEFLRYLNDEQSNIVSNHFRWYEEY
jgi:DNA-binding transcriptional LysR family regulator